MKRPILMGRIMYWLGWPVSFLSLVFSKRSRVLIICEDEVLLAKNWLGSGDWHCPGGGIRNSEDPAEGAVRELEEELGLKVEPTQLQSLYNKRVTTKRKLTYHAFCFALELTVKPKLSVNTREIISASWHKIDDVKRQKLGGRLAADMVDAWEQPGKL